MQDDYRDAAIVILQIVNAQLLGKEIPPRMLEAAKHINQKRVEEAAIAATLRYMERVCPATPSAS